MYLTFVRAIVDLFPTPSSLKILMTFPPGFSRTVVVQRFVPNARRNGPRLART